MPRNPLEAGYSFTRLRLCKNRILDRGVVDAQQLDGTDIAPGPRYQSRSRRPTAQRSAEDVVIGPTDKASTSAVRVKHNQSFPFGLCTRQEPRNIPLSTALMQDSVSTSTPTNWHGLKRPFRRAGLHSRSITKTGEMSRNGMFWRCTRPPHATRQPPIRKVSEATARSNVSQAQEAAKPDVADKNRHPLPSSPPPARTK